MPTVEDPEEGARRLENGIKGLTNEIIELGNTLRTWKTQGDESLRELAGLRERGEKGEKDLAEAKSRLSSIQELVERERAAGSNEIEKLRADCIVQVTAAEEAQGKIAGERIRGVEREVSRVDEDPVSQESKLALTSPALRSWKTRGRSAGQ